MLEKSHRTAPHPTQRALTVDTNRIDDAIRLLDHAAGRLNRHAKTSDDYSYIRDMIQTVKYAEKELRTLERELPRMVSLKRAADRAYDAHVTREKERR